MVDEEEETITDEERLQIAQHFLLSSPPCQFHEVLTDVKKILPDGLLTDPLAAGIARAHNVKTGRVIVYPDDSKVCTALSSFLSNMAYTPRVENKL